MKTNWLNLRVRLRKAQEGGITEQDALAVSCPRKTCGAAPQERCVTGETHAHRYVRAWRRAGRPHPTQRHLSMADVMAALDETEL